jgi:hypothetical protein
MESSGKRQCLPQADDDDVPPTLEVARRMQQQSLLRGLDELSRREGDLTLVLDGGVELRASRVVLMASCAYFRRRLDCSWEGGATRLELGGVSAAVVEAVLSFVGSGSAAGLSRANAQEVLAYADFLGVAPLCGACRRILDPDAERTRPSLAAFAALTSGRAASVPSPPPADDEASPHGFALVLQMAQGTMLVLPFNERRSDDLMSAVVVDQVVRVPEVEVVAEVVGAPAPQTAIEIEAWPSDHNEAWPRFGEFRWRLPESTAHESEVLHAAVWRQADDSFCVFRDLSGDGQRRGAESSDGRAGRRQHDRRRFSDATWPVTSAYAQLLRLHRVRAGEDEEEADGEDDGEEDAEAELLSPAMFRLYRWPEARAQPPPDLLLEMDTQLSRAQLAQLLSGSRLLEWETVPEL